MLVRTKTSHQHHGLKTSPPAASRDSNIKSNVSLNPRDAEKGIDEKSQGTGGGILSEYTYEVYKNPDKVEEY
jgi:hypothetical protein